MKELLRKSPGHRSGSDLLLIRFSQPAILPADLSVREANHKIHRIQTAKNRKIVVSSINRDKGATANKACSVACIACKACVKACGFDAIAIENFLAFIDPVKCTLCRKCVAPCQTDSILEINFPPLRVKEVEPVVSEILAC